MAQLPQSANRLQPAEDLLDQLPLPLTDLVTGMPGGPAVADTAVGTDAVAEFSASGSGSESADLTAPSTPDTTPPISPHVVCHQPRSAAAVG